MRRLFRKLVKTLSQINKSKHESGNVSSADIRIANRSIDCLDDSDVLIKFDTFEQTRITLQVVSI